MGMHYVSVADVNLKKKDIPEEKIQQRTPLEETLEKKIESLSKELEQEDNHEKQKEILKSINLVLETIEKIQNRQ